MLNMLRAAPLKICAIMKKATWLVFSKRMIFLYHSSSSPFQQSAPCQISGRGLTSATVNHPTHIVLDFTDSSDRPYSLPLNVSAQLELASEATPTSQPEAEPTNAGAASKRIPTTITEATPTSRWPWSRKKPSRYQVSYTPVSRGQHKLHLQVNSKEINGSPFTVTVYPDPRQLGLPVRTVTDLNGPYGIVFNSHQEMIVSECLGHRLSIFDIRGQKIRSFGSPGDSPDQMEFPAGIATDDTDNIYVSSEHKLQKFTSSGELIKYTGKKGSKEGEFDVPRGVTLYDNQVYVCDVNNHRIQVFDLALNFIRSIGSRGSGSCEFNKPHDVKFDTAGNMYVADYNNKRVQVLDISGQFIRAFGQEGEGKLNGPSGLHIVDKYVYVSDHRGNCVIVYETSGQFVTLFGRYGLIEGEFCGLYCITSCTDGFIYVCDWYNERVQIF